MTVARILSVVLVGVGGAGLLALLHAQESALYLGMVGVLLGGIFIGASNQALFLSFIFNVREPWTEDRRQEVRGMLGSAYGGAGVLGLIGAGLVVGSALPNTIALLLAGVAGIAALLIGAWPGTSRDIRAR